MKKRLICALLACLMLATLLCACGAPAEETTEATATAPVTTEQPTTETPATEEPTTEAVTTEAETETETEAPTETQKPTNPPATTPTTTAAPEPTEPVDKRSIALNYIGSSVSALYSAIGRPNGSSYASSCEGECEDGELYYDGFTVYTHRYPDGTETIYDVW